MGHQPRRGACAPGSWVERQGAFTVLELLVVIGILGLLIGLVVPALSSARRQAKRTACLANLHSLSGAVTEYATEDRRGFIIPVHPIANTNPLHDEGYFDYGGQTGAANIWQGRRLGPSSERQAATRPLNYVLFSEVPADQDNAWRVFRCPGDERLPRGGPIGDERFWDPNMAAQSMFESTGTSYLGNAYRETARDDRHTRLRHYQSIGTFLRSAAQIPSPGLTIVLCEAVMWYNATAPAGVDATIGWQGLTGWHGDGPRYNLAFADGHADFVYAPAGTLTTGSDPAKARLYLRGRSFRFDTFPAPPIDDPP